MTESKVLLTLVIPTYNEEKRLPITLETLAEWIPQSCFDVEVIIVDDGSNDTTPQQLSAALARYPWLRVLRMVTNKGQSAAFDAGFKAARGEVIATIDADLQNDPEEIPRLLSLLNGYDMIAGWRQKRQDTSLRRIQSRIANRIRNWISEEDIRDSACSLKLYKRHCLDGIQLYNGMHRFMPPLVKMRTAVDTPA